MDDLYVIKKSNTSTNSTEVHILSAGNQYQNFVFNTGTKLEETYDNWAFATPPHTEIIYEIEDNKGRVVYEVPIVSKSDVIGIKKYGTDSKTTEIHILAASLDYLDFSMHTKTALEMTDDTWAFLFNSNRDFYAIQMGSTLNPTRSGFTEINILPAESSYQTISKNIPTALAMVGDNDNFVFLLAPNEDLFIIKKNDTDTHSTEIHVLSAKSKYQEYKLHTGTPLGMTDDTWDFV
jgi:hypothetical protein